MSQPNAAEACAQALTAAGFGDDDRLCVAVSGGPDSLALLLVAHDLLRGRVLAATVDHGLRADSAGEADAVAALCAARAVPHTILRLDWPEGLPGSNVQAQARERRYGALADWCQAQGVGWLATAHHLDDQAETLVMRLARGSGAAGLAGIRPVRDLGGGVRLVRPLLAVRRTALAAIAARAGMVPVNDPANADPAFDRTRARALLAREPWLDPVRMAGSAAHLAAADAALDWVADEAARGRSRPEGGGIALDIGGLPMELVRRMLLKLFEQLGASAVPSGPELDRLMQALAAGGSATLCGIHARGGREWRLVAEALRTAD